MQNMTFDLIDENLKECWGLYKEYLEEFRKNNYSDAKADDFIDWCMNSLYKCPDCGEIVLLDWQAHLFETYNTDCVCDDCLEANGYYE